MVETINPAVSGDRRTGWKTGVALHVAGATLAASGFGALLGAAGGVLGAPWGFAGPAMVALVAAVYAAGELTGVTVPVPQARRQVPDWWRTFFSPQVFSFLYGLGLGVGFLTYLARGTLVVVAAAAFASGRPLLGMAMMVPFGAARGASVLVARRVRSREEAVALVDRLVASSSAWTWRAANGMALLAIAAVTSAVAARDRHLGIEGLASAILVAAFGWAAVAKALRPAAWRHALQQHELPAPVRRLGFVAVPLAEAVVAGLALVGLERASGALALSLLVAFSAMVLRTWRIRGDGSVPCGCFARRGERDLRAVLVRNGLLAAVALGALIEEPDARAFVWPGAPTGGDLLPAALSVASVIATLWMSRQVALWLRSGVRS